MPVKRCLIEETIVFYANWINNTMNKSNDKENTILPINARIVVWIADVNNWSNKLRKTEISRGDGDYMKLNKYCFLFSLNGSRERTSLQRKSSIS
jgi:hypothetical protein